MYRLFTRPSIVFCSTVSAGLSTYLYLRPRNPSRTPQTPKAMDLSLLPAFETTFAVPMHCASCVSSLESAVQSLQGIKSATASLSSQTLHVTGTAAPSSILSAIQGTGRDGVLRGSGASDSAAVAILETYEKLPQGESPVRGLVRLVQVAEGVSVVDVSVGGALNDRKEERINGEKVGTLASRDGRERTWRITLRQRGDLSRGPESTGGVYTGEDMGLAAIETTKGQKMTRGEIGEVKVDKDGRGSAVLVHPVSIWEVIGRGLIVEDAESGEKVAGVMARSAGVWDNDKVVCSCSGKTVWEEREEQRGRGML